MYDLCELIKRGHFWAPCCERCQGLEENSCHLVGLLLLLIPSEIPREWQALNSSTER